MKSPEILRQTAEVLGETQEKVNSLSSLPDKKKIRVINKLEEAKKNFLELSESVTIDNEELANFFYKRAVRLKNMTKEKTVGEDIKAYLREVELMLRYSRSAPYDFTEKIMEVNRAYKAYLFGMVPFFILAGIFGPAYALTALILIVPVLLSMLSIRKRGSLGVMLAFAAIPVPLVMAGFSVRYGIYALTNQEEIARVAEALGKSLPFAQGVVALVLVLGLASLVLLSYAAYSLYKHRHAFL